jgi:hypothetical protein
MVLISAEYQNNCEPDTTKYGRFLKSYHLSKGIKNSKIQKIIDNKQNNISFPTMSKLDFLKNYLLNTQYQLNDFLNISSPSLRGFFYETIWDICIKCNVVPGLDNSIAYHMEGKVEELRKTKDQIKRKLRSLKVIDDIYTYLKTSNVQSGNTGGISDITLQYKTHDRSAKSYILISCKYYVNEKAVTSYDIAELQHVMKDADTHFDIVLLVADRKALMRKVSKSHKPHTKESMKVMFDKTDLAVYFNRLRSLFKHLNQLITTLPRAREEKLLKSFFSNKNWKPLVDSEFHTHLLCNASKGNENVTIWNSAMPTLVYKAIMFKILEDSGKSCLIVCNEHHRSNIVRMMDMYFGYHKHAISFVEQLMDISDFQVVFVYGCLKDLKRVKVENRQTRTVYICDEVLDDLPMSIQGVKWNMENHMMLQYESSNEWMQEVPQYLIEQSLADMYGHTLTDRVELPIIPKSVLTSLCSGYMSHGSFYVYTNTDYNYKSPTYNNYSMFMGSMNNTVLIGDGTIEKLFALLFGSKSEFQEPYVFFNRMNERVSSGIITIIMPKELVAKANTHYKDNTYLKSRLASFQVDIIPEVTSMTSTANIIIAVDNNLGFDSLYAYVNRCYEKSSVVLVDFSSNRLRYLYKRFKHVSTDIFDEDIHGVQKENAKYRI